jgi:hypothetical protein
VAAHEMAATVRVEVHYRSPGRVTPESRVFLYGSAAHSDLSWEGTPAVRRRRTRCCSSCQTQALRPLES